MEIKNLVRQNILNLKPYTSARDIYEDGEGKVLLDANENSNSTFTEINNLKLNRYPDPHQKELKKIVGEYYSIPEENLFFGVGSDEIVDLLIRVFCDIKDAALIPEPTYGMYKVACDINNIETKSLLLSDDFQLDLNQIKKINAKIIFLCSPNNPVGNLLNKNDVLELCKIDSNSIIIVDEAYIDFCLKNTLANEIKNYPNLIILRTFSKAWGLAGIRLGYCIADEEIIKLLFKVKAPYNINTLTKFALESAIVNASLKNKYVKLIIKERERLKNQLESLTGIKKVYSSNANFLLFECENAKEVQEKLADSGIIIRDRSSQPKLGNCLRVSIGNEVENDIFWEAIKKILS